MPNVEFRCLYDDDVNVDDDDDDVGALWGFLSVCSSSRYAQV